MSSRPRPPPQQYGGPLPPPPQGYAPPYGPPGAPGAPGTGFRPGPLQPFPPPLPQQQQHQGQGQGRPQYYPQQQQQHQGQGQGQGAGSSSSYPQFAQHLQQYQQHMHQQQPPAPTRGMPMGMPPQMMGMPPMGMGMGMPLMGMGVGMPPPPPMGFGMPPPLPPQLMPLGPNNGRMTTPTTPTTPTTAAAAAPSLPARSASLSLVDNGTNDVEMEIEDSVTSASSSSVTASSSLGRPPLSTGMAKAQTTMPPGTTREISAAELDAKRLVEKREEKRRQKGQELRQRESQEAEKREKLFSVEDKRKILQQQHQHQQEKKHDWFLGKLKYRNTLPDIPFDPKLLQFRHDPLRFVRYIQTPLEKGFKFEFRPEPSLGINIDLIDLGKYAPHPESSELSEADAKLLEKFGDKSSSLKKPKEARGPKVVHHFLRRTEYTSGTIQPGQARDVMEGAMAKQTVKRLTAEEQVAAVNRTFDDVRKIPKHPQLPTLKILEVIPLFPNFELAKNSYVQCQFDSDPSAEVTETQELSKEDLKKLQLESAIMKPMINPRDKNDSFVVFALPNEDAVLKRQAQTELGLPEDEEDEYKYDCVREYSCTINRTDDTRRNYFLVFQENNPVFYTDCHSTLSLHIRGTKRPRVDDEDEYLRPSGITLKRRELTEEEKEAVQSDEYDED